MQDELGVSRELVFNLPLEKKWELYLSKQKVNTKILHIVKTIMYKLQPLCKGHT